MLDLCWLIMHLLSEQILLLPVLAIPMPTAFVIQEHLTLTSALISLLGEGEKWMNQSCLCMVNVWARSIKAREKLLSFAQAGHRAADRGQRFFVSWEQRKGKIPTTATPRNAAFLFSTLYPGPLGKWWCARVLGQQITWLLSTAGCEKLRLNLKYREADVQKALYSNE